MKKALKITSTLLMAIVVILSILLVGVKLAGIDVLTIISPSMEPKYPTGSLVYLIDVDPSSLEVGDVITFQITKNMTATHRIKEIVPDEDDPSILRFRTKGDNNDAYDGNLVEFKDVKGKVIFCIPLLGYLAQYIQTRTGSFVVIGIVMAVTFFVMAMDTATGDKKVKNKSSSKGENEK